MAVTEVTLTGGERVLVEGDAHEVESAILAAARGSLMELAWLVETESGHRVGMNPDHVLMLRAVQPGSDG